jgi:hypothetical protein
VTVTASELEQVARDGLERYWRAVELADGARAAWVEAGRPLTVELSNGVECEAPILKLLRECERDCERLARALPRPAKRPGRPPVAVLGAGGLPPTLKFRRGAK